MNSHPVTSDKLAEQKSIELRSCSGHHFSNELNRQMRRFQLDLNQIKKAHKREIDLEDIRRALFEDGQTL